MVNTILNESQTASPMMIDRERQRDLNSRNNQDAFVNSIQYDDVDIAESDADHVQAKQSRMDSLEWAKKVRNRK